MKAINFFLFIFFFNIFPEIKKELIDLEILGECKTTGSIPQIALSIINLLNDDLKINFIPTESVNFENICNEKILNYNCQAKVSLLTDMLTKGKKKPYQMIQSNGIKIAYSMLESTKIPSEWVNILNNEFDAVIVPDQFVEEVYINSGVKIPIFMIPIIINFTYLLENRLKKSRKKRQFIFGTSIVNYPRKNMELLINAFSKTFFNDPEIMLKIHTKSDLYLNELIKSINDSKTNNIELIKQSFNEKEYAQFISSLDCFVLISKGEGFSITPREALAAGTPCIISNNTGHKTICDMGYVYAVPSIIEENAYYPVFKQFCGKHFNCNIEDISIAFKTMLSDYNLYLEKAYEALSWLMQYDAQNLKNKYLNIIKPKKIFLDKKNEVTDNYLMTSSTELYNKYLNIINYL